MVTAIVIGILVMGLVGALLEASMDIDTAMLIGLVAGVIAAFVVPYWIGRQVSYIPDTEIQPMVSIITNSNEEEIYLKAISGSELIYWIDEDGLPREQTILVGNVNDIKIEPISPYLETTTYLFKEEWYKYFMFSSHHDEYVFHVPVTGVEANIFDLLK